MARLSLIRFTMKTDKTETGLCSPCSPALAAEHVTPSLVTFGDNGSNMLDPFTDGRIARFRSLGLPRSPSRKRGKEGKMGLAAKCRKQVAARRKSGVFEKDQQTIQWHDSSCLHAFVH